MHLTVPYVVLARCEDGDYRLLDETEIDIPEIAKSEAPKAASYCDLNGAELLMRSTLVYQGRFFAPAIAEKGKAVPLSLKAIQRNPAGVRPPSDLLLYIELNGGHGDKPGEALRSDLAGWYKGETPRNFMDARSVGRYTPFNDQRRQQLIAASRGLLLIDGWLHYETREPFIAVTSTGDTLIRTEFDMRPGSGSFAGDLARFSLADAERAEEFANREFPDRGPIARRYDRLSVPDPEAFHFDAISDLALRIGQHFVGNSRHQIGLMQVDQVRCWLNLRDETEAARAGNGDPLQLLELITEFLERQVSKSVHMDREITWLAQMIDETGRQLPSPRRRVQP